MSRVSTQGCSEPTCIYHGEANRRKLADLFARQNTEAVTQSNQEPRPGPGELGQMADALRTRLESL